MAIPVDDDDGRDDGWIKFHRGAAIAEDASGQVSSSFAVSFSCSTAADAGTGSCCAADCASCPFVVAVGVEGVGGSGWE